MSNVTHTPETCACCGSYTRDPQDRMTHVGFGHCVHDIAARYRSPGRPCAFSPSRFVAPRPPSSLSEALRAHRAKAAA